jgi:hypothetical protein
MAGTLQQQAGSFHPMPVIGHPVAWYGRHIEQAEAAGDVHARASHKVGQYVTEAIDPKAPWDHKIKCFKHALKHYAVAPDAADEGLRIFYKKLGDVVRKYAGNEALHEAQRFSIEAQKRTAQGEDRAMVEDDADDFYTHLMGHERTPEWCTPDVAERISKLRQQWG